LKSNYKLLGNYIRQVNNRNTDLITKDLRGLSMTKEFRKSTSNIVGTDLSKYKLVYNNQFACDFMSVIRVHKLPVVLHNESEPVIISPAYIVFEVIDESELSPEYLMMWFRRSEFDRYADFRCDSAIRGGFKWDELGEVEIPIPSIEKQQDIVNEYNTITNRIALNEQLNQKLEETSQALYKHWFVDFEFPNEEGEPYKSSGGVMIYNEELDKEIPEEWEVFPIESVFSVKDGTHDSPKKVDVGHPLVTSTHLRDFDISIEETYNISEEDYNQINKRSKVDQFDILFSMIGTVGLIHFVQEPNIDFAIKNIGLFKSSEKRELAEYVLCSLKGNYTKEYIKGNMAGSTQSYVTLTTLRNIPLLKPCENILREFNSKIQLLINSIFLKSNENQLLKKGKSLVLSKMTKVEVEKEIA
jgi:type I restriction enzyme S subunit